MSKIAIGIKQRKQNQRKILNGGVSPVKIPNKEDSPLPKIKTKKSLKKKSTVQSISD